MRAETDTKGPALYGDILVHREDVCPRLVKHREQADKHPGPVREDDLHSENARGGFLGIGEHGVPVFIVDTAGDACLSHRFGGGGSLAAFQPGRWP